MSGFVSEALDRHDRASFASGNARLDDYFRKSVSQDVKRKYAACYVLVEQASGAVAGFYTLSATHIPLGEIPSEIAGKLPRYPTVPAILIGWLARDRKFRGQDLGVALLYDAMVRVVKSPFGAWAICADAIDDAALDFYHRNEFVSYASNPAKVFLPVATARILLTEK